MEYKINTKKKLVTVIDCSKQEEHELEKRLKYSLKEDYNSYGIIYANKNDLSKTKKITKIKLILQLLIFLYFAFANDASKI